MRTFLSIFQRYLTMSFVKLFRFDFIDFIVGCYVFSSYSKQERNEVITR